MPDADGTNDYVADAERAGLVRWKRADMPIAVFIAEPSASAKDRKVLELVKQSFAEWCTAAPNLVSFKFVTNATDAKIHLIWGAKGNLPETAEAGEAQVEHIARDITGCNIVLALDQDESNLDWDEKVHSTALHEIGHALGLIGHSPNSGDVMYYTELMSGPVSALSGRDKKTIQLLYGWSGSAPDSVSTK